MSSFHDSTMRQHGGSGSKSRGAVFASMCGMVILSAAQFGMAIYLLLIGTKETLLIATESFMIYSSSISLLYLGLPLLFFRRCQNFARKSPQVASKTKTTSLIHIGLIVAIWTIASVLCLIIAIRDSVTKEPSPSKWHQNDMKAYKVQMASIATSFSALLLACVLFWSIHSSTQPILVSLFGIYRALRNRNDEHPVSEKRIDDSKHGSVTTQVSELLPSEYLYPDRADTQASWRPHTNFQFPGKAPPRGSLKISHPYPIPTNNESSPYPVPTDGVAGINSSPVCESPTANSIASHSRQMSNLSSTGRVSHQSPRRSLSDVIPLGRTSNVSTTSDRTQHHVAKESIPPLPTRPISRPVMPPAAFWRYAVDKQAVGISPGILQGWQLDRDRQSWPPSTERSPTIPTPPKKAATVQGRVNRRSGQSKRKASSDSLKRRTAESRESTTECIEGITWEIAGGRPSTQDRENVQVKDSRKGQGRKLVKKRPSSQRS